MEAIAEIGATPRKPEPNKREGLLPRRINTKDAPSGGLEYCLIRPKYKDPDKKAESSGSRMCSLENTGRPRAAQVV